MSNLIEERFLGFVNSLQSAAPPTLRDRLFPHANEVRRSLVIVKGGQKINLLAGR